MGILESGKSLQGEKKVSYPARRAPAPGVYPTLLQGRQHSPQILSGDVEDLEKLIENVSGNAEIIPRALLRVIRLEQLIIKILKGEV